MFLFSLKSLINEIVFKPKTYTMYVLQKLNLIAIPLDATRLSSSSLLCIFHSLAAATDLATSGGYICFTLTNHKYL